MRAFRQFSRSFAVNTKRGRWLRRGTTASSLHPCHLLLPAILASSSCAPPYPSASPRRADLLVFFPFGPLSFDLLALYSVTATFVAPRAALPFSLAASSSPVHRFSLCPSGYARFLFAPRFVSPFSPSSYSSLPALRFSLRAGPVASFVFVERTRTTVSVRARERERETRRGKRKNKREKLRAERKRRWTDKEGV